MNGRFQRVFGLALASVVWLLPSQAIGAPQTIKASYSVSMNAIPIGTISEVFEAKAGEYRIVSDTKPSGLAALVQRQPLRFSSSGRVGKGGLQPAQFEARRTASDAPEVSAEFDWEQSQLVLKHDGKSESLSLPPATQDRLSVMYQFMYLPPPNSAELRVHMTNGRKLDHYGYTVKRDVEVDTALGRLKTMHLVKIREQGEPGHEVWLSPKHHYLPVKVAIIERDGMRFEQVVQSLELRD